MKAFLLIISMGWCLQGWAQQDYFVFVQSEKRQPFYVRLAEKNYSSSSTGHVILSKLKDSSYVITVGFPQNQFPEQDFTVRVSRRDRGFELKNLGEKGWALFDWQTMELINAARAAGGNTGGAGYSLVKKSDDFAKLMASVVNDTAVMYTVVMEEKKQPVLVAKDTVKSDVAKIETKPVQEPEIKKPEPGQKADTVRATNTIIPKDVAAKDNVLPKDSGAVAKQNPVAKESSVGTKPNPVIKDSSVIAKQNQAKDSGTVVKVTSDVVKDSAIAKVDPPARKPDEIEQKTRDSVKQDVAKVTETKKPEAIVPKKTEPEPVNDSVFNPPALPVIYVVKELKTDTGYHMIIADVRDSIDIFIPADAPQVKKEEKPLVEKKAVEPEKKAVEPEKKAVEPEKKVVEPEKKAVEPEKKTIEPGKKVSEPEQKTVAPEIAQPKQESAAPVKTDTVNAKDVVTDTSRKQAKLFMINSDCRAFATANDVDKLRVKLINEKDSEGRIAAARKVFKTKCFSALQIKALSENFPLDEQKYKFLEMAYPFVSDTGNFKSLVSLLQDPVYVQRFRKMVRLD